MKKEIIKIVKPKKKEEYTLDIDAMVEGADEEPTSDDVVTVVEDNIEEPPKKRGPGRPPKNGLPVTYTNLILVNSYMVQLCKPIICIQISVWN